MQAVTDVGAQEIAPFFSSSLYAIGATLVVTAFVLLLMSVMPRLVSLFFRRLTPDWIDGITTLLMVLLLLGQATIMLRWLWPDLPYVWPLLLLVTVVIAAFLPANPISDGLAYLRLRRGGHYQVWDRITVGKQQGQVAAVRPLYTELVTATAERVRLPNSVILQRGLVVHGKEPTKVVITAPVSLPAPDAMLTIPAAHNPPAITQAVNIAPAPVAVPAVAHSGALESDMLNAVAAKPMTDPAQLSERVNTKTVPLPRGPIPPLRKRQGLGATSIKGLMRT